ncbi:MAG TPA: HlyD family efflux transporter periplasmic adaptor subunit [Candidatus Acidoferrales bacterium]|nr:HlyD family efflux transporter periplasmic adaptor subunit [Candidatus Acidoferrales bacterium]
MNRTLILVGVAVLLLLAACSKKSEPGDTIFVSGRIDGDTVDIASKRDGRITDLAVREGDSVQAGQPLAHIYSPQDVAQVDAQKAQVLDAERRLQEAIAAAPARVAVAEANLSAAKAELVRSEAELKQAQLDAKRYPPLVQTGAAPAMTADQYSTKVDVALASTDANRKEVAAAQASLLQARAQLEQISTARATVASRQAELRRFQANVTDLTITAPIAGTILTRSAEPGRVIAAGQTVLTMVDLNKLYLRGFIPEGEIGHVKVGQRAQVWLDSNPNQPIEAEVIRIDPQVMFTPENTYFKDDRVKQVMGVKLGLKGAYGLAKPGMPADGRIYIGH